MDMHGRWANATRALIAGVTAVSVMTAPVTALACTQVYVGPELTAAGDTIYGRSEDAANRYLKEFGVAPRTDGKTYWSGENGPDHDPALNFTRTSPGATYRYTYVRDLPSDWDGATKAYSEAGTNECGVSVDATLTTACNDGIAGVDPLLDNGIGEYNLTDVVLSESATAREGVELIGSIIDEQGSQDCNQIWIGDANEVWNFQQLSGRQWIAVRMAHDVVSLNPNMSNLQFEVDIDDAENCLHSADLVKTAEDAGTLVTNDNGSINVAKSYGLEDEGAGQDTRYVQGHRFFGDRMKSGREYTLDEDGAVDTIADPQLFFTPKRSDYGIFDMLRSVTTRGEGTKVDANKNDKLYAIGNNRTVECHIFQTRAGLDPDIATVQWQAMSRGEFSVYVPTYSALLTQVDPELYPAAEDFDPAHVGEENEFIRDEETGERIYQDDLIAANEELAMQDSGSKSLAYLFMDLNTLAYNHRADVADGVHAYLDVLQQDLIAQQEQVDAKMQALPAGAARNALANEAHANASRQVFERCNALLGEVRTYLEAGDFSAPFAASDLADGALATPLTYADDMDAFDAEAAAADVVEPVAEAEEDAEAEAAEGEDAAAEGEEAAAEEADASAEEAASQDLTGSYQLFAFLAALAALIFWSKKSNK